MLAGVGGLFYRDRRFAFHHKPIEVLGQQHADSVRHRADYSRLDLVDLVENAQSAILEDRVSIQYEEPCFHKCASKGKK
jgi:hypothetical protein